MIDFKAPFPAYHPDAYIQFFNAHLRELQHAAGASDLTQVMARVNALDVVVLQRALELGLNTPDMAGEAFEVVPIADTATAVLNALVRKIHGRSLEEQMQRIARELAEGEALAEANRRRLVDEALAEGNETGQQ